MSLRWIARRREKGNDLPHVINLSGINLRNVAQQFWMDLDHAVQRRRMDLEKSTGLYYGFKIHCQPMQRRWNETSIY